jgi:AraC family transcriptional regulator of adaptative response/methylated-DNA-[protein]-cysteine methyltransferase
LYRQIDPEVSAVEGDYVQIDRAMLFIKENFRHQPRLSEIAAHVGLSEYHFQRKFQQWAGVSPKRFLQFLTVEYAKNVLEESRSVLDAAYHAGLSGPSRLHDLFVTIEGQTPGEFKDSGEGMVIRHGIHMTPFGRAHIGVTERGICGFAFLDDLDATAARLCLEDSWPRATLIEDSAFTKPYMERIFGSSSREGQEPLPLLVKGTQFHLKAWRALLRIPPGYVLSYGDVGEMIGERNAARAVGNALALNPIAYLIPCHRVIREMGILGSYRWRATRKMAMFGWEAANREAARQPAAALIPVQS